MKSLTRVRCYCEHRCLYSCGRRVGKLLLKEQRRTATKMTKPQDPEIVENMPVFQYASDTGKIKRRLYIWGNAAFGCLGIPGYVKPPPGKKPIENIYRPVRLKFADENKIHDVACGTGFTIFSATSSNHSYRVFGTGLNTDSQIGYHCEEKGRPFVLLAAPVPIQIPFEYTSTRVVRVAAGRAHTIVLTDNEGAFSLGNNSFGQCGRPVVPNEIYEGSARIHKIDGLPRNVADVVCGQDHTIFLTKDGEVFCCGWGADGQTGLRVAGKGHYNSCGMPTKVAGDVEGENIIHVSGAVDCTLAVSDKGDVFGWGNSEYSQLISATSSQQINVAKHLPLKNVGKVVQVAAGGTMCAVLNDKGQVYVWGYGILGQGPEVTLLERPSLLPAPLFGCNEFNPDTRVASISCGLSFFGAITNRKDLYVWGKNRSGCLGLGHLDDQYFPFRVTVPASVTKVSCGVDHTVAMCQTFL